MFTIGAHEGRGVHKVNSQLLVGGTGSKPPVVMACALDESTELYRVDKMFFILLSTIVLTDISPVCKGDIIAAEDSLGGERSV